MPSNLLIPGKNALGSSYLRDSQTIEQWARQPIQQLKAGSGITLSPASGLATDKNGNGPNPITISSTGGGGGVTVSMFIFDTGPDSLGDNTTQNGGAFFGGNLPGVAPNDSYVPMMLGVAPHSVTGFMTFGLGWAIAGSPGSSVVYLPFFTVPTFTGGPIIVSASIGAISADNSNQGQWFLSPQLSMTSGQSLQTTAADWTNSFNNAGDLSFVAGTGDSGNGIVQASSRTYLGGIWGTIDYTAVTAWT